jgi:hypothetical protein
MGVIDVALELTILSVERMQNVDQILAIGIDALLMTGNHRLTNQCPLVHLKVVVDVPGGEQSTERRHACIDEERIGGQREYSLFLR